MGEDPYLVSMLGAAYVRGLQSAGVIATGKHFAGYSASRGARNHGPVPMGRRDLMDVILPPFEAAVTQANAGSVVNSSADMDNVPAGADSWLLTDLLRHQWGFRGTVVSDCWAVPFLAVHRLAANLDDAGALALAAGIDVELPDTSGLGAGLLDKARSGELPEALVNRAARRLLLQKAALGLLDPDWSPERSVAAAGDIDLDSAENRALAREMAERSVVLLDPGSALPLLGEGRPCLKKVAVVGLCVADPRTFMGCYSFPNHVLPRHPDLGLGIEVPSALDGLRAELSEIEIVYAPGCEILSTDRSDFADAVSAAQQADVCLASVGSLAGMFGQGTSGEGCDAEDLRLPGLEADLLEALLEARTMVVIIVVSGRPYALGGVHGRAAALVQAFMLGEEGGESIAGVLSGRIQPSGRLPVQIPRRPGGQPGTYLEPPLGADNTGTSNLDPTPLFPFGHGCSYTAFEIEKLRLSSGEIPIDGEVTASVRVRNTGARAGEEVVQLYVHDVVASVTRPVKQLGGFTRVCLNPGEEAEVSFRLDADRTAFTGRDLQRIVEAGEVKILLGRSASDLSCQARVRPTGPTLVVGLQTCLVTAANFVARPG